MVIKYKLFLRHAILFLTNMMAFFMKRTANSSDNVSYVNGETRYIKNTHLFYLNVFITLNAIMQFSFNKIKKLNSRYFM